MRGGYSEEEVLRSNAFFMKGVPVFLISFIIWFISTLSFASYYLEFFYDYRYILAIIFYFALWILTIYFAVIGANMIGTVTFFIASALTGYVQSPIILWATSRLGSFEVAINLFYLATIIGMISTVIGLALGYYLYKLFNPEWYHFLFVIMVLGLLLLLFEFILWLVLGYELWYVIISVIGIIWMTLTIIYDGMTIADRDFSDEAWLLISMNILLDMIYMILEIFKLLVIFTAEKDD
jgi:FtsH-binding integral membrane protein